MLSLISDPARAAAVCRRRSRPWDRPPIRCATVCRSTPGASSATSRVVSSNLTSHPPDQLSLALDELDPLVTSLVAFSALTQENMTHNEGWHFLEIGRRLERGASIARPAALHAGSDDRRAGREHADRGGARRHRQPHHLPPTLSRRHPHRRSAGPGVSGRGQPARPRLPAGAARTADLGAASRRHGGRAHGGRKARPEGPHRHPLGRDRQLVQPDQGGRPPRSRSLRCWPSWIGKAAPSRTPSPRSISGTKSSRTACCAEPRRAVPHEIPDQSRHPLRVCRAGVAVPQHRASEATADARRSAACPARSGSIPGPPFIASTRTSSATG